MRSSQRNRQTVFSIARWNLSFVVLCALLLSCAPLAVAKKDKVSKSKGKSASITGFTVVDARRKRPIPLRNNSVDYEEIGSNRINFEFQTSDKVKSAPISCKDNSVLLPGASECTRCTDNTVPNKAQTECVKCEPGTEARRNRKCVTCKAGRFSPSGFNCDPCSGNTISGTGAAECLRCASGTRANASKRSCILTSFPTSQPTSEPSSSPITCKPDSVLLSGASECTRCTDNTVPNKAQTECVKCEPGTEARRNRKCVTCKAGRFSPSGFNCDPCSGNTISGTGAAECLRCASGTRANASKRSCILTSFPTSQPTSEPSSSPITCKPDSVLLSGASECTRCTDNTVPNKAQTECVKCEPGTEARRNRKCVTCKAGRFSPSGFNCDPCSGNTISGTGAAECLRCASGTRANASKRSCILTESPTNSPISPTPEPSVAPTMSPTNGPTTRPTYKPTESPTAAPTSKVPTESPIRTVSALQTQKPSPDLTATPTIVQTIQPTSVPISVPTASPVSVLPTLEPSSAPISCKVNSVLLAGASKCTRCRGNTVPNTAKSACVPCPPGSETMNNRKCVKSEPQLSLQPRVVTVESAPARKVAGVIDIPEGTPWCGEGNPTYWLPGHKYEDDAPNCLIDGAWRRSNVTMFDIRDRLNDIDGPEVIDRHDCDVLDVNNDGILDVFCLVGANKGTGEGYNELYLTEPDGSLRKVERHGLQKHNTLRGRFVTVLKGKGAERFVFIATKGSRREDGRPNYHVMYRKTGVAPDYFEEVPGPFNTYSYASIVVAADVNNDGLDDLLIANHKGYAMLFLQTESGGWEKVDWALSKRLSNWRTIRVADFDGDDRVDLLVARYGYTSTVRIFRGIDESPYFDFGASVLFETELPFAVPDVEVLDVNSDGIMDFYAVQSDESLESAEGLTQMKYCAGKFYHSMWWPRGNQPPPEFVPPNDKAADILFIGNGPGTNRENRFSQIAMNHSQPGCGNLVRPFGDKKLFLAQGDFARPGHNLVLEWD